MESNEELFDEIEAYLRGEMSPAETETFAVRIGTDPELAAEVTAQQLELDAIEVLLEDKLRANMNSWEDASSPPAPSQKLSRGPWLWLLALCGLAIAGSFLWPDTVTEAPSAIPVETPVTSPPSHKLPSAPAPEQLETPSSPSGQEKEIKEEPVYAQKKPSTQNNSRLLAMATTAYRQPEELTLKSVEDDTASPLDAGLKAYAAEDFTTAISEFSALDGSIGEAYFERAQELLGHAYFRAGRYTEAAEVFATFAADTEFRSVREYGEWYLLLSLLPDYGQQKRRVDALLAKILGEEEHGYGGEVEKIKRLLK